MHLHTILSREGRAPLGLGEVPLPRGMLSCQASPAEISWGPALPGALAHTGLIYAVGERARLACICISLQPGPGIQQCGERAGLLAGYSFQECECCLSDVPPGLWCCLGARSLGKEYQSRAVRASRETGRCQGARGRALTSQRRQNC